MTVEEARARVDAISAVRHDDEIAHGMEDVLREDFIKFVAEHGPRELAVVAESVLESSGIIFDRWCA